jgi:NodT family efflux transporter outer membrane factor (OMF) lipoprotein
MRLLSGFAALALAGIAGCTVGPDFTPPKADTPADWSAAEKATPAANVVTNAAPAESAWWTAFNDAELTALLERARDANPNLQMAALRIAEARAQIKAVDARNLPSLSLDSSYARTALSPNGALDVLGGSGGATTASQAASTGFPSTLIPLSIPPFDLFQTGFDASWEIDVFGGVRRSVESAEAQAQGLVEDHNDVLVSVYAEVARTYIQLRGVQKLIEITQSNLKAQQDAYNLTHAQAQGGETSNLDVESASAEVATTEAQLPALQDEKTRAVNALSLLVGLEPGALEQELDTAKPLPPNPPKVPIGLPSDLARRRPDIRKAETQLHVATANIGVATADLYPKLSLTGSFGLQAIRFSNLGDWASKFYNFGPALSIPVFNGTTYANISVQEARQKEAALNYRTTVLDALHEVENAVSSYGAEQVRVRSLQRAATANEHALSLARQRYQAGLSSFLDVLDSERRLYASQTAVEQSEIAISTDLIAIYKALGGGWDVGADSTDNGMPQASAGPQAQTVAAK